MKLVLSKHAKDRTVQRKMDESMIKEIITNPDIAKVQEDGKIRVEKQYKNRKRSVIYKKDGPKFVIITVI